MKTIGERKVPVASLTANLFVRTKLDEDHVEVLMGLISGGTVLEPIEVIADLSIVDGRHRREAYEMCDVAETTVRVLSFDSDAELITYAFRKNTGGSKPPTTADIQHTIEMLLERGVPMKTIVENLGLPAGMTRNYIQKVKDRLTRAKVLRAAAAVTDGGMTLVKAAEQFGADPDKLKEQLSGRKRKQSANGISEVLATLSANYRSWGQKNASTFKKLMAQYDDGDVTEKEIRSVLDQLGSLQKGHSRAVQDWSKRFNAKFDLAKAPVEKMAKSA